MKARRREIILGVGGGIAAYKSCDLLRRLKDLDFEVTVVPTPSSLNFVGKATWEALSGRKVTTSVFEDVEYVRHVELAKVADAIIISPATADLIARIAQGRADDLLTNIVLASQAPKLLVPAMHPAMWFNDATQSNLAILRQRGFQILEPEEGPLTSGDVGKGRLPSTETILSFFHQNTIAPQDLAGKHVLVSAGGTREPIDPVRYIGNRSSGKQGIALAEAALSRGADVTLVIANSELPTSAAIRRVDVETAVEMLDALSSSFDGCDFLFMAAAVADATPSKIYSEKIKKDQLTSISLVENPDILAMLTVRKRHQKVVAFAAETAKDSHLLAREKLVRKGADLIYLNDVSSAEIFGSSTTQGFIIDGVSEEEIAQSTSKESLAHTLINRVLR